MRFMMALSVLIISGCTPSYTWGYRPSIHPDATSAYIHAVMEREAHHYARSLAYYDEALRYTWSPSVKAERDEVAELFQNTKP